jgi:hypothetical protein
MRKSFEQKTLTKSSLLFWLALVVPVSILPLGINFLLNPVGASTAFGIPITDPTAFPYMWTKGIRDLFSGLVMLPFFIRGERRTIAMIYSIATFIPIGDGLIIFHQMGVAPPIFVHWGTALFMIIISVFLFRTMKVDQSNLR